MHSDNLARLHALLPSSGFPDDLQQWLIGFIQDAIYSQRRRDALIAKAIQNAPESTLWSRCRWVSEEIQKQSDDPVIIELKNWPQKVPQSIRQLKTIAKKTAIK